MSRIPRMYLNTQYFHVMSQGINKRYIFNESIDIKFYIKNMYELQNKYNIKIIAYCVMSNHVHMLLNSQIIENLSMFMHDLNTKYACYYNKKYERVGYVFRDRYKSQGIYSRDQLYCCLNYIYNNPVKAKICKKPEEYPYSNYKKIENIKINSNYSFIDVDNIKEDVCRNLIINFLNENSYNIEEIRNNKIYLQELIVTLKTKYNVSLRNIAKELNISREKVRKIFNQ